MSQNDFTIDELRDVEVAAERGNAYLVRFGEDDYRHVNRTPKHELLLETDVLDRIDGGLRLDADDGRAVTAHADFEADRYRLEAGGRSVTVPSSYEERFLELLAEEDGEALRELHEEIVSERVRVGLMDQFMPRFAEARDEGRLHKGQDGWVIDDTFVVHWNGENYLAEGVDTHVVENSEAVKADEERQARVLSFDLPDETTLETPAGQGVEIDEREAKFLATTECLLNPREYLTDEEADRIEAMTESVNDPIASFARTARVKGFTDEKSGLYHDHGLRKHTLDQLGVTEEAEERLFYNSHDHAGVHEMKRRREEFEDAPFEVFEDAPNDDPEKWERVEYTSKQAPIPQNVRSDIDSRFR